MWRRWHIDDDDDDNASTTLTTHEQLCSSISTSSVSGWSKNTLPLLHALHRGWVKHIVCCECSGSVCTMTDNNWWESAVTCRLPTGPGNSRKVMEFWMTIFQAWKVMEISKGPGKSWKMMIMSLNFYNCTEKFCSCNVTGFTYLLQRMKLCWTDCCEIFVNMCKYTSDFIFLTVVQQAAATVTTN